MSGGSGGIFSLSGTFSSQPGRKHKQLLQSQPPRPMSVPSRSMGPLLFLLLARAPEGKWGHPHLPQALCSLLWQLEGGRGMVDAASSAMQGDMEWGQCFPELRGSAKEKEPSEKTWGLRTAPPHFQELALCGQDQGRKPLTQVSPPPLVVSPLLPVAPWILRLQQTTIFHNWQNRSVGADTGGGCEDPRPGLCYLPHPFPPALGPGHHQP